MKELVSVKLTTTLKKQLIAHLRYEDENDRDQRILIGGSVWLGLDPHTKATILRESNEWLRELEVNLNKVGSLFWRDQDGL